MKKGKMEKISHQILQSKSCFRSTKSKTKKFRGDAYLLMLMVWWSANNWLLHFNNAPLFKQNHREEHGSVDQKWLSQKHKNFSEEKNTTFECDRFEQTDKKFCVLSSLKDIKIRISWKLIYKSLVLLSKFGRVFWG